VRPGGRLPTFAVSGHVTCDGVKTGPLRWEHAQCATRAAVDTPTTVQPCARGAVGCKKRLSPQDNGVSSALARERLCTTPCRLLLPGRHARPWPCRAGGVALQARAGEEVCGCPGSCALACGCVFFGAGGRAACHRHSPRQEGAQGQRQGRQQRVFRHTAGGCHEGALWARHCGAPLRGRVLLLRRDAEHAVWCAWQQTFKGLELLKGVSWEVKKGDRVGLVGACPPRA
jgi:hypothetical protein